MMTSSKADEMGASVAPGKNTAAGLELMEQLSQKLAAILETVLLTCVGLELSKRMC